VRVSPVALALITLVTACGSTSHPVQRSAPKPKPGTLEALWKQPGESVALILGSTDYSIGNVRISFLVVNNHGRVIAPPKARFWIARAIAAPPLRQTVAHLESVGVPGVTSDEPVKALYVAHIRVPAAGTYYVLARPIGSVHIGALAQIVVNEHSSTPAVGEKAYPSDTPTLTSAHGRTAQLTTRIPPDRALLRYSVKDSLAAHMPFVLTFATPRWCSSRTCGPVVDVVDAARRHFGGTGIRFIHVEIYAGNDPRKGYNRWYKEWHLTSEPWTFLVGADGRIRAKFSGSVSLRELDAAIRRYLR
jgi:hypothetical protein